MSLKGRSVHTLLSGPEIPSWSHIAVAHRETDQSNSGLNAQVYSIQQRPPQHQNTGNQYWQVFSAMLHCFHYWGFPQTAHLKPLLTKPSVIQTTPPLWTRPFTIVMVSKEWFIGYDCFDTRHWIGHAALFWYRTLMSCTVFSLSWKTIYEM